MLNYLRKMTQRKKTISLLEFKDQFWRSEHHSWIKTNENYVRAFQELLLSFDNLSSETRERLLNLNNITFIPSSAHLASSISKNSRNIIIVFPDLLKLLNSAAYMRSVAIFAHELGHLVNDHSNKNLSPLDSQIQADQFAVEAGLAKELEQVLLDYPHSIECKIRITKITAFFHTQAQRKRDAQTAL